MPEGKGLLGSVMGALFEAEEAATDSANSAPAKVSSVVQPPIVTSTAGGMQPASAGIDPDLLNKIRVGTYGISSEYVTFMDAAKLLEGIIPDEGMRLKAALASSKVSSTQIARSITTTHGKALSDVVAQYKSERDKKFKKDVADKQAESTRLGTEIQALEKQAADIQAIIQSNRAKQAALSGEAESARILIEGADDNFAVAQSAVSAELAALANKIKSL
jgi:hypothetical protein